jgi:hypothetical protein
VPKVQDLYGLLIFIDVIVDTDRCMQNVPYSYRMRERRTHAWESGQQFNMIQEIIPEACGRFRAIDADIVEDVLKIV